MEVAFQLGNVDQAIMNGGGADGAAKDEVPPRFVGRLVVSQAAVMPDQSGILISGIVRVEIVVGGGNVVVLGGGTQAGRLIEIDAPKMADAVLVLGILADADIQQVLVD